MQQVPPIITKTAGKRVLSPAKNRVIGVHVVVIAYVFAWREVMLRTMRLPPRSQRAALNVLIVLIGEGILFAPAGLGLKEDEFGSGEVAPLGRGYVLVKSRLRITRDGGHSLLAVQAEEPTMVPSMAIQEPSEMPYEARSPLKKPGMQTPPVSPPRKQSDAPEVIKPKVGTPPPPSTPSQSLYTARSIAPNAVTPDSPPWSSASPPTSTPQATESNTASSPQPARKRADLATCSDPNVARLVAYLEERKSAGLVEYILFKKAREAMVERGALLGNGKRNVTFVRAQKMGFVDTRKDESGRNWVRLIAKTLRL
ncbi:hypothetical protein PENSPDRAFT_646766 [Peniophora sp. CONT]|nr:hypothetical protein PENSPDRAFT_646766 [Peniophora sp. CONT]